jgi:hypothetical protein
MSLTLCRLDSRDELQHLSVKSLALTLRQGCGIYDLSRLQPGLVRIPLHVRDMDAEFLRPHGGLGDVGVSARCVPD